MGVNNGSEKWTEKTHCGFCGSCCACDYGGFKKGCRLLFVATSATMLSENKKKRRMWSKKWYLKRNISCGAHLLNELLETDVPWDDAIVVWAGKLRKLWGSLIELRSSLCERRLERTVLMPALLPVKTAQFTQFSVRMTSHCKSAQFNWECIGRLLHSVQKPCGWYTQP